MQVIIISLVIGLLLFVVGEILYIRYNGSQVARPNISRQEQTLGNGSPLAYVVMGDSTAVSQGGTYSEGYATKTAAFLARHHAVRWINVAVSGARASDVLHQQLPLAVKYRPDVVLIAVGANDITHVTNISKVCDYLATTIDMLRQQNPNVQIVLTGSPDMGSIPRFPQPVRWLAGKRTQSLNQAIVLLAQQKQVTFAPIAKQTGSYFREHPEAFAADKFHPNTEGYEHWIPVITQALSE